MQPDINESNRIRYSIEGIYKSKRKLLTFNIMINPNDPAFPFLEPEIVCSVNVGMTIRTQIAAMVVLKDMDTDSYSMLFIEDLMGRKLPVNNAIENVKFWAEYRSKLRVIEADALITELNRTEK